MGARHFAGMALAAWVAGSGAGCGDDGASGGAPDSGDEDGGTPGGSTTCTVVETGETGETADQSQWPDACAIPHDGQAIGFQLDGPGWTELRFANGVLTEYDSSACTYCSPAGQPQDISVGGQRCLQQYDCGVDARCVVRVYIDETTSRWTMDATGFGCTAPCGHCDLFPTGAAACIGLCASRQCGQDGCGSSCGRCEANRTCESGVCRAQSTVSPACDSCLDACSGLPSCCTGCGCICESDCAGCF